MTLNDEYALQPDASWQPLKLTGALAGRSGRLLSPEGIVTPPLRIASEHRLYLTLAAEAPAQVEIVARAGGGADWQPLARCAASPSQQIEIGLAAQAGRECEFRVAPVDGAVHVLEFSICPAQRHGRVNAFTGYDTRLANELKHFSGDAYTHRMYGDSAARSGARGEVAQAHAQTGSLAAWTDEVHARCRTRLAALPAEPDEPAFTYAMRTLSVLVPPHGRTFVDRVREMSRRGPLKILSLCAGAARIEEDLLAACEGPVQLTLVDASEDLLQRAAGRLGGKPQHRIECLVGDVNEGLPGEGQYDVIVCVSALHHIADLERVLAAINLRLAEGGQFWSIGEQVGRNGNRLWPDALEAANRAFARLPAHLRRNAHTGEVDPEVSDRDYSVGCFEGVRSQELEELMERYLVLAESYKRNAFLWRLVDGTYTDNYDLTRADDLEHLRELIAAEVAHWAGGGRSTEFYGVFRKKTV